MHSSVIQTGELSYYPNLTCEFHCIKPGSEVFTTFILDISLERIAYILQFGLALRTIRRAIPATLNYWESAIHRTPSGQVLVQH